MSPRAHTNLLQAYLNRVADTEPSGHFHLWTIISLIASCLGRKCEISFGPETFFPNFYIILVGPPGARKGTAIKYGIELVKDIKPIAFAPQVTTRQQFFAELENAQQLVQFGDTVMSHCSIFVAADELANFLGDNDPQRLADLCKMFDGIDLFEYKTKHSGSNYIPKPAVWLLGATTPQWIEACMPQIAIGGGITSRIVFVYAPKKDKHIPLTQLKPFDPETEAKLVSDLSLVSEMQGKFFVDSSGDETFSRWYLDVYPKKSPGDNRLSYFMDRLPAHVAKLCMITSASRSDSMTITGSDVLMAVRLFDQIIPNMTHALGGMGLNVLSRQTEMLRVLLKEQGPLPKSVIMRTLRMHLNEFDYVRVKMHLVSEKSIVTRVDEETREEILVPTEDWTKKEEPNGNGEV